MDSERGDVERTERFLDHDHIVAKKAPFSDVKRRYILELLSGPRVRFHPGELLLGYDEPVARAYILRSGWACRRMELSEGRWTTIHFIMGRELVGLFSLLANLTGCPPSGAAPTAHRVVALTPVDAVAIEPKSLKRLIACAPADCLDFLASYARERFRLLSDHIVGTSRSMPPERLARFFIEVWARQLGSESASESGFLLPIGNAVMSEVLEIEASRVARMIATLERVGIISRSPDMPDWISVREPELLRKMARLDTPPASLPLVGTPAQASA